MENNQKFEQPLSLTLPHPVAPSPEASSHHLDDSSCCGPEEVEEKRKCHTCYQKGGANKGVVATGMKLSHWSTPDSQGESRVKMEPGQQARLEFQREFSRVQSEGRRGFFEAGAVHSYIYIHVCWSVYAHIHMHTQMYACIYMIQLIKM